MKNGGGLVKSIELLKVNELYAKISITQPKSLVAYKKFTGYRIFCSFST
ncbi:MAG: hypothetical protein ACI8SC_002321 [Colwellia sp.]|jgi:hypothetical protein